MQTEKKNYCNKDTIAILVELHSYRKYQSNRTNQRQGARNRHEFVTAGHVDRFSMTSDMGLLSTVQRDLESALHSPTSEACVVRRTSTVRRSSVPAVARSSRRSCCCHREASAAFSVRRSGSLLHYTTLSRSEPKGSVTVVEAGRGRPG